MTPKSEDELAQIVKSAHDHLGVQGGGTRGLHPRGDTLHVAGLKGVSLYEPGALTIVAQAGTSVSSIEAKLAKENQRLAFEPMDHRGLLGTSGEPTIGGVIACNVSGPRRIQVGAARDFALGVRFVDGAGHIIKNGGRVMKNVTGYDLVKLMCGSYGTLGVLTEVALKVLPIPETQGTLLLRGLTDADAVGAMAKALGSPFEVSAAAHTPQRQDASAVTMLRVEGFEASVSYRLEQLKARLADCGNDIQIVSAEQSARIWTDIRDVGAFHGKDGDVWRVSCKPSDGPDIAERCRADELFYDWAGGLIWVRVPEGTDLRARIGAFQGHATLVRGTQATHAALSTFHPETPGLAKLTTGLRAKFDPRGILNAGLMGAI